jgi:putative MFS transporter
MVDSTQKQQTPPRWIRNFAFLGTPPAMTARQWRVLGIVAAASFFDQYDTGLFSLALKQIQADLMIPEESLGLFSSAVALGSLPAIFLTWAADRLGRRRLLMATILGYTLLTGATAFSPNAETFVVLQFFSRMFITAEYALAIVVIGEELDDDARGWGIGALAALAACGHGLAYLLFGLIDLLPFGWRSLYLVGLGPLLMIAWFRRGMSETPYYERFATGAVGTKGRGGVLAPFVRLVRDYPGRFAAAGSLYFLLGLAERAAFFFAPKYLQDVHAFPPIAVGLMGLVGGGIGIFANTLAGRWSDRFGRKPAAIAFLTMLPLAVIAFYNAWWGLLPFLWFVVLFSAMGGGVLLSMYGVELFPTSYRSTAAGARAALGTLGAVAGLAAESALYAVCGSHWVAISVLTSLALVGPLIIFFAFPETSGRSLDEISPER